MQKIVNCIHILLNLSFLIYLIIVKLVDEQQQGNLAVLFSQKNTLTFELQILRWLQIIQVTDFVFSKGSVVTIFIQQLSRNLLAIYMMDESRSAIPLYLIIIPWLIADITRFAFYIKKESKLLQNLRYNLFLVLYPLGGLCEYVLLQELGNLFPETISQFTYNWTLVHRVGVIIGMPYLYIHMLKQRSKHYKRLQKETKQQ